MDVVFTKGSLMGEGFGEGVVNYWAGPEGRRIFLVVALNKEILR